MSRYWIVNGKSKKYMEVDDPDWEGSWKGQYPHTRGADWVDVYAYRLWDHDMIGNGIPYVYDLVRDGGLFTLLVDTDKHTPEDIKFAKAELRHQHDVVSLSVLRVRRYREEKSNGFTKD
jgi:hypothetical protein